MVSKQYQYFDTFEDLIYYKVMQDQGKPSRTTHVQWLDFQYILYRKLMNTTGYEISITCTWCWTANDASSFEFPVLLEILPIHLALAPHLLLARSSVSPRSFCCAACNFQCFCICSACVFFNLTCFFNMQPVVKVISSYVLSICKSCQAPHFMWPARYFIKYNFHNIILCCVMEVECP